MLLYPWERYRRTEQPYNSHYVNLETVSLRELGKYKTRYIAIRERSSFRNVVLIKPITEKAGFSTLAAYPLEGRTLPRDLRAKPCPETVLKTAFLEGEFISLNGVFPVQALALVAVDC